jgi:hypothetical protein
MAVSSVLEQEIVRKPPVSVTVPDSPVVLTLSVDDPDVVAELIKRQEGAPRTAYAASALRIGVLALRQAEGHIDAEIVRTEGQRLIGDLNRELAKGIGEIDSRISSSLRQYFDPKSGHFTERVERLVRKDGDLERVLRLQIGDGENSELARALAMRIGENSPLMRRLNPGDAASITHSIENSVNDVLDAERKRILSEFSLDNENGARTRVVSQLNAANEQFKGDVERQIREAVSEFSLDDEDSALSRLVKKVEEAKDQITDEFSLDNEDSAINKLNHVLVETKRSINDNLTLDNDQSALARLKNQLTTILEDIRSKNQKFQEDVSTKLATLITKHQEEMRSTTHGLSFEEEFCAFLQREAQRASYHSTVAEPRATPGWAGHSRFVTKQCICWTSGEVAGPKRRGAARGKCSINCRK